MFCHYYLLNYFQFTTNRNESIDGAIDIFQGMWSRQLDSDASFT